MSTTDGRARERRRYAFHINVRRAFEIIAFAGDEKIRPPSRRGAKWWHHDRKESRRSCLVGESPQRIACTAARVFDDATSPLERLIAIEEESGIGLWELYRTGWSIAPSQETSPSLWGQMTEYVPEVDKMPAEHARAIYETVVGHSEIVERTDYSGRSRGTYRKTTRAKRTKAIERWIAKHKIEPKRLRAAARERGVL